MQAGHGRLGGWGGLRDAPEYKLIGCIQDHLQQCIRNFQNATHAHHAQHFWQGTPEYKMTSHLVFETIFSTLMLKMERTRPRTRTPYTHNGRVIYFRAWRHC